MISVLCVLIVSCAVWVITADPFFGFGYHDFGEQLFTLVLEILVPPVLMAATDCLTTVLFKKRFIALIIAETVLMCVKRCLSFLSCLNEGIFGITEPAAVVVLTAVLYAAFFLALFFAYILIFKAIKNAQKSQN